MKHTFHKKLATPKAWLAVAILGAIMIALPNIIFADEDGLGTNVMRNIRIQPVGVGGIDLGGTAITNWNQVGSTVDVANLQTATNLLNTATNLLNTATGALNMAVGNLNTATNLLNTATNLLNTATNALQIEVITLNWATNELNTATNALQVQAKALQDATNTLNTATNSLQIEIITLNTATNELNTATNALQVQAKALQDVTNTLNTRAVMWDNAVICKQGSLASGGVTYSYSNLYQFVNGVWSNANANTNTAAKGLLGLALGSGSIASDGLLLNGMFSNHWGFADGSVIYMDTNSYQITTNVPSGTNNVVRILGYTLSPTNIYFNPDRTYIEVLGQ